MMDLRDLCVKYKVDFPPYASDCPPGWLPLVEGLFAICRDEFPGVRFEQIKEKFATLRIYYAARARQRELALVVKVFEKLSASMCQTCGRPGVVNNHKGWLVVECDEHGPKPPDTAQDCAG